MSNFATGIDLKGQFADIRLAIEVKANNEFEFPQRLPKRHICSDRFLECDTCSLNMPVHSISPFVQLVGSGRSRRIHFIRLPLSSRSGSLPKVRFIEVAQGTELGR